MLTIVDYILNRCKDKELKDKVSMMSHYDE